MRVNRVAFHLQLNLNIQFQQLRYFIFRVKCNFFTDSRKFQKKLRVLNYNILIVIK